jgi:hypothetical protein
VNNAELLQSLDQLRAIMTSVATGGARIQDQSARYTALFRAVDAEFRGRGIDNPIPFPDLWDWYGRWSQGDLPQYRDRRRFLGELFESAPRLIHTAHDHAFEATGWERIDRTVQKARANLASASNEEDFQAVGLLCREVLITLGQEVWDVARHPPLDGVDPSETDAKRRIGAYVSAELAGGANEEARKHALAALALAVALQHRRTADFRDAAMCLEGTTSVVNLVAIIEGRRDRAPEGEPDFTF